MSKKFNLILLLLCSNFVLYSQIDLSTAVYFQEDSSSKFFLVKDNFVLSPQKIKPYTHLCICDGKNFYESYIIKTDTSIRVSYENIIEASIIFLPDTLKMHSTYQVGYLGACPNNNLIGKKLVGDSTILPFEIWENIRLRSKKFLIHTLKNDINPQYNPLIYYDTLVIKGEKNPTMETKVRSFKNNDSIVIFDIHIDFWDEAKPYSTSNELIYRQVAGIRYVVLMEKENEFVVISEDAEVTKRLRISEMQSWYPMKHTYIDFCCDINNNEHLEIFQIGWGYEANWYSFYEIFNGDSAVLRSKKGYGL